MSCLCCSKFIGAYNQQHDTAWTTAATHGKFYQWSFLSETMQPQPQQPNRPAEARPDAHGSAAGFVSPPTDASAELDQFGGILVRTLARVTTEFAVRCEKVYAPWPRPSDAASDSGAEGGTNIVGRGYNVRGDWGPSDEEDAEDEEDEEDDVFEEQDM